MHHHPTATSWTLRALRLTLVLLVLLWATIHFGGDRWWPATLLMFAPRWPFLLPLPVLLVLLVWTRASRQAWATWALALVVALFPIMDLCVPWRRLLAGSESTLRILTVNLGGGCDEDALRHLIEDVEPDIVCCQETPRDLKNVFPDAWRVHRRGDLVVASGRTIRSVEVVKRKHPPTRWPRPICHLLEVGEGDGAFRFATLHLQSPRYGLAAMTDARTVLAPSRRATLIEQTENRRQESRQVSAFLSALRRPLIIAGDFNTPRCSTIFRESWGAYADAFSQVGLGFGWTVRVVQAGIPFRSRIDHVLATKDWVFTRAWVGPDVGSDHVPLIVEVRRR